MSNKKPVYAMFILIALAIGMIPINFAAFPTNKPVVYVDPPNVNVAVGNSFTISLKIFNVTGLYGFDIKLRWNPSILNYTSRQLRVPVETYADGVLHTGDSGDPLKVKDSVNATAGTYQIAYATMSPAPSFNGSGTVFNMTFKVLAQGRMLLEIFSSKLSDKDAVMIDHEVQSGFFQNYTPLPGNVYMTPSRVVDPALVPCTNFTVNIKLEKVYYLDQFEFWIAYNNSILETEEVTINETFPPSQTEVTVNEGEGKVKVKGWLLPAQPSFTGNITLSTMKFHVTGTGNTAIDLYNVTLIDDWGDPISSTEPGDGYFSNIIVPRIYVDPPERIDPTLKPGNFTNFDIKMQNVIDFYSYEFHMTYDKNVLTCLGLVIVPPNNETNFSPTIQIDNALGHLKVNVTYYPPAGLITILTSTTIATIYFQVKGYGVTTLDLHDTGIANQGGNPIGHEAGDGFFATIIRDVAIGSVSAAPDKVYAGRIVNITVLAQNLGDIAETFNVTIYYNSAAIGTQTVVSLPSKQNTTLLFRWNTTGLAVGTNATVSAQATQVPYETDILNNAYTDGYVFIKMIGDVNGDRIIDIFDVTAAGAAYDSHPGDPNWNEDADVAPAYGLIDVFDIVTICAKYGLTY
jgi:hypothetical protein